MLLFAISTIVVFISCSSSVQKQDGFVQFSVEGETYRIEGRRFIIRANPMFGDGRKTKSIPEGEKMLFEFSIGPTDKMALKEIKMLAEEMEKAAKGDMSENFTSFDVTWLAETNDPEQILKSRISMDNKQLGLTNLIFTIRIPDGAISNPDDAIYKCWINIDEITKDRAKGRFGGSFLLELLGKKLDMKLQQGFFREIQKEIEISDGIFDVPYKKCFKY